MALPINIKKLIENRIVESSRLEYKTDWNPEAVVHSITAFANDVDNSGGGYIIIGIAEENGMPVLPVSGLDKGSIDRIQKELLNKCNLIEPRYLPVVEPAQYDGKDILVIWVPGGDDRPYKCPSKITSDEASKKSDKACYIRKMSNTIKANSREERDLLTLMQDIPFDDRINHHADVADMRSSLISEFLHSTESNLYSDSLTKPLEDIAESMKLVRGPAEYRKPLNIGLMFFNERPDNFFPYSQIEVVIKPDSTGIGMREKIFRGPLDKQLRDALLFIKNTVIEEYVTKLPDQAEAVRVFNWPYRAVEEALCNAIYHRSYQIQEPVTVTVTPEAIEILSLPGPDNSISDDDIAHNILISSQYRNRRIGDFLKELKLVEGRNTGIPLILNAMKRNGSDMPEFKTNEGRTFFRVRLPIHPVFLNDRTKKETPISPERVKHTSRTKDELSKMIVLALRQNNLSLQEIAIQLGYSKATDRIRSIIRELLSSGEAELVYPDNPTTPKQKIRLKKKG